MKFQTDNDNKYHVTIKRCHLDTLLCAAEWVLDRRKGRVPREAKDRLQKIIESYQEERSRLCK